MHCDLDLWPFDLKINRAHPWLMGSLHVKFHDDRCKGKAVMRRKPKCGGQTDGQMDMVIPVYPPNFVAGGIIKFDLKQWTYSCTSVWILPVPWPYRRPRCLVRTDLKQCTRTSVWILPAPWPYQGPRCLVPPGIGYTSPWLYRSWLRGS